MGYSRRTIGVAMTVVLWGMFLSMKKNYSHGLLTVMLQGTALFQVFAAFFIVSTKFKQNDPSCIVCLELFTK